MKAKNLGLIVAGLMSLATAKGFSQETVNIEPAADGYTYYNYNSGGQLGGEIDGTLYLTRDRVNSVSGETGFSLSSFIESEWAKYRTLPNTGVSFPNDLVNRLENILTGVLNYNTMDKKTTPENTSEYMKERGMLLKTLTCYMIGYNIEPSTGSKLSPEIVKAYMNDDFFINKEVFTAMPNLVIDVYEQIATMYYNKAKALPKDSPQQKAAYLECARFAYEEPVANFGETEWLSAMTRSEIRYLDIIQDSYYNAQKISESDIVLSYLDSIIKK